MTTDTDTRTPRAGGLPEHTAFADTGCDYAPKCLECPFAKCRYDMGSGGLRTLLNVTRDRDIRARRAVGESPDELAAAFAVSRRTIFRVLGLPS